MTDTRNITIRYSSCDGVNMLRRFKTLKGAQRFAHNMVGPHPEIGGGYAMSGDAVGKVRVAGCTLADLFPDRTSPKPQPEPQPARQAPRCVGNWTNPVSDDFPF